MKITESFIDIFKEIIKKDEYKDKFSESHNRRLLTETDYFRSYLFFLNNSIYYSRFTGSIKNISINGKYLNEKVNKWVNMGLFKKMYMTILRKYIKNKNIANIRVLSIDSQFISNRFMNKGNVARNKFYKNKRGLKITSIVDESGVPLSMLLDKGNKYDSKILINSVENLFIDIKANVYKNSKKYRKSMLADAGYDSKENRSYLISKHITPIIDHNKRNTKDKTKIKKFNKQEKKKYRKRLIIENFFS